MYDLCDLTLIFNANKNYQNFEMNVTLLQFFFIEQTCKLLQFV